MKSIRVLFFFVVLCAFAGAAEACLTCQGGACNESPDGYCSGQCCGASMGDPCRIPDFFWPCYSPAQAESVVTKRDVQRLEPSTYFSSRQPLEQVQRRFVARTRKCAAPARPV